MPVAGEVVPSRANPVRGIITARANVRATPSLQSSILAVLPIGAPVEFLGEQGPWSQIRTAEGLEAWVYQSLVRVAPEPRVSPMHPTDATVEQPLGRTALTVQSIAHPLPHDVLPLTAPSPTISLVLDTFGTRLKSWGGALLLTLVVVLIASIVLQLRAGRQLKRTRCEMESLLDWIEGLSTKDAAEPTSANSPPIPASSQEVGVPPLPGPQGHLSPLERAVIDALRDRWDVREDVLRRIIEAYDPKDAAKRHP